MRTVLVAAVIGMLAGCFGVADQIREARLKQYDDWTRPPAVGPQQAQRDVLLCYLYAETTAPWRVYGGTEDCLRQFGYIPPAPVAPR